MKTTKIFLALLAGLLLQAPASSHAATLPIDLGAACGFAVLGGTGITNTGPSTITGDVGNWPDPAQVGLASATIIGTNHGNAFPSQAAQGSLTTAYNDGAGRPVNSTLAAELGGTVQLPGVYNSLSGAFGMTGTLTLDGNGESNPVFIFIMATSLVTAGSSAVALTNGATAENVFWIVGSSATLGASSVLQGNILALTAITTGLNATVNGRILARNALIDMDDSTITNSFVCPALTPTQSPTVTLTGTATSTPTVSATNTETGSVTSSPTVTTTGSGTASATASATPTATPTGTAVLTMTGTATATTTASATATPTAGSTPVSPAGINLGAADGYSVLAGSGITNTGPSDTDGYVGTFPTTTQDGFETLQQGCTNHAGDSFTQDAKTALTAAYIDASTRPSTATIPTELGSSTRFAGVYDSAATTFELTGILTLDGGGNTSSVFIFKTGSTLVTAPGSSVILTNGALAKNVFWAVGTSATLDTGTAFIGTIMAQSSITLNTGASVKGRILAMNGAVTMDTASLDTSTVALVPCTGSTMTPTRSATFTVSATATGTQTPGGSPSNTRSATASATATPTHTPGSSVTATPTATPSRTPGGSSTASATPTSTSAGTVTVSSTPAATTMVTPAIGDSGTYFYPSPVRHGIGAVAYQLAEASEVTIRVYNQPGRLVDSVTESKAAGVHSSAISVSRFASGTYYYVLSLKSVSGVTETQPAKKFVVIN